MWEEGRRDRERAGWQNGRHEWGGGKGGLKRSLIVVSSDITTPFASFSVLSQLFLIF